MDSLVEPFDRTLKEKLKDGTVKQEVEKMETMQKAALRGTSAHNDRSLMTRSFRVAAQAVLAERDAQVPQALRGAQVGAIREGHGRARQRERQTRRRRDGHRSLSAPSLQNNSGLIPCVVMATRSHASQDRGRLGIARLGASSCLSRRPSLRGLDALKERLG